MRPMFVSFTFLFFINVLSAPIDPSGGNAVALRRRSPNEHDESSRAAQRKAAHKCKLATPNELIEALKSVDAEHSLLENAEKKEYTWVYHLTAKVDDENLILKVIRPCKDWSEERIKKEVWALYNVGQLRGSAHTPDRKFYYIFMKNMGVPLQKALEIREDPKRARELREEAEKTYFSQYRIHQADHDLPSSSNWVYRKVGGEWQAELIDWFPYVIDKNYKGFQNPPEPFVIHPDSVPETLFKALKMSK